MYASFGYAMVRDAGLKPVTDLVAVWHFTNGGFQSQRLEAAVRSQRYELVLFDDVAQGTWDSAQFKAFKTLVLQHYQMDPSPDVPPALKVPPAPAPPEVPACFCDADRRHAVQRADHGPGDALMVDLRRAAATTSPNRPTGIITTFPNITTITPHLYGHIPFCRRQREELWWTGVDRAARRAITTATRAPKCATARIQRSWTVVD